MAEVAAAFFWFPVGRLLGCSSGFCSLVSHLAVLMVLAVIVVVGGRRPSLLDAAAAVLRVSCWPALVKLRSASGHPSSTNADAGWPTAG